MKNLYLPQEIFDGKEYILPELPYGYDELEPSIDEKTVRIHHDKHHASYVKGANNAMMKLMEIAEGKGEESLSGYWAQQLSFHTSGHILHSILWNNMTPEKGTKPSKELQKALKDSFGSYDNFISLFKATASAVQGSGWAMLGYESAGECLCVCAVEKHQDMHCQGVTPLLVLDVWEHAYYLKHQNDRAGHIKDFIEIINWEDVSKRLETAQG